jgi:hypothetical protein
MEFRRQRAGISFIIITPHRLTLKGYIYPDKSKIELSYSE